MAYEQGGIIILEICCDTDFRVFLSSHPTARLIDLYEKKVVPQTTVMAVLSEIGPQFSSFVR